MKFKEPIGQIVKDDEPFHVIGVIKDFILRSPYEPTRPMIIEGGKGWFNYAYQTEQSVANCEKFKNGGIHF